jgi:hypothetical protein
MEFLGASGTESQNETETQTLAGLQRSSAAEGGYDGTEAAGQGESTKASNGLLIGLIVAVVIIVALVVCIVVLVWKLKGKNDVGRVAISGSMEGLPEPTKGETPKDGSGHGEPDIGQDPEQGGIPEEGEAPEQEGIQEEEAPEETREYRPPVNQTGYEEYGQMPGQMANNDYGQRLDVGGPPEQGQFRGDSVPEIQPENTDGCYGQESVQMDKSVDSYDESESSTGQTDRPNRRKHRKTGSKRRGY